MPRCKDYAVFEQTLRNIDQYLIDSELESQAIDMALAGWEEANARQQQRRAQYGIRALRVEVLRFLLGGISFRRLSVLLGSSELLADFCRVRQLDGIRNISKSNVERYSKFFTEEQMRELHKTLCEVAGNADLAGWAVHALRHRDLLEQLWEQTDYSAKQVERIMARIEAMAAQIPAVIGQAHERLIGERKVPNARKILSVHEPQVHVIVRGKAGKQVEFGNTLLLCESAEGLLVDWKLYREKAPPASMGK